MPRLQAFTRAQTNGALALFAAEGWDTYTTDPERTVRALSAPGCTTLLALDGMTVVALAQVQSDGEIQAHLSNLIVARPWRRRGLGRRLLHEALKRAGGLRIDVLTQTEAFYESLGGEPTPGFRLDGQRLNLDEQPHDAQIRRNEMSTETKKRIDGYLQTLDEPQRSALQSLRRTILEIVPGAEEVISYGLPAFRVRGETIAGFGAFTQHLSYLPFSGSVLGELADELDGYTMTSSSLHFGVDEPLSKTLVQKLIRARLAEVVKRSR